MKKLLLAATLLAAMSAQANQDQEICDSYANLASIIMEQRQSGVSMREMMGRADGREPHESMVVEVYGMPQYSTPDFKNRAINEYADRWYLNCIRRQRVNNAN